MRDTSREPRECNPKDKEGYIFVIKEIVGRGEDYHFLLLE